MKKSILVKNIRYLVTCDENDRVLENASLYIKDGVIEKISGDYSEEMSVESGSATEFEAGFVADEIIDGTGMLVYPGLVNTHHHLFQVSTRNLPQVQNMELFPWLTYLYGIWQNIDSELVYYTSLIGMGELLKTGCTTCLDHHYLFPSRSEALIDAQFQAASELGIRMHSSRGSMNLSKKDGGLPPDSVVQSTDQILRDSERVIDKYNDSGRYSMRRVILAPCAPFNVTEDLLVESAKLARSRGVYLHTHLCETMDEERYVIERFGIRPLEYMEKIGWLGPDVSFAHGIHFNDQELELLAKTGTGVAHCPVSNMKLSSGIARIPEMLKLNIPVGIGVDGSASNDGSNILEEMRIGYLLHRLKSSNAAPTGYDFLKIATTGGARLLGRDDIGMLREGMAGDLFMINSKKIEFMGALSDPKSILATVGYKGSVDYTIVAGKVVVRNGKLAVLDEEELVNKGSVVIKKLISKSRNQ